MALLPEYDWDIVKAGIAAGYSKRYCTSGTLAKIVRADKGFCGQMQARAKENNAAGTDRREKRLRQLDAMIDDTALHMRDRVKAMELQARMCGWLSETRILETHDRQRVLTESEQAEAKRYALWRYDTMRRDNGITDRAPVRAIEAQCHSTATVTTPDGVDSSVTGDANTAAVRDSMGAAANTQSDPATPQSNGTASFPSSPRSFSQNPSVDEVEPQ